jgi:hypothetical protein
MFTRSLSGTIIKGFIPVLILMILLAGCRPDDKNTGTAGPAGIKIKSIFIDPLGRKWFATENGLSVYNDNEWKTYTTRDGLGGNTVFSFAHSGRESDLVVFTEQAMALHLFPRVKKLLCLRPFINQEPKPGKILFGPLL